MTQFSMGNLPTEELIHGFRDEAPSPSALAPGGAPCPNCGSLLVRRYCPDCGQAALSPDDYSLRAHAADLVGQITNLDGRIARTVRTLVARPGVLTADHLAGRRAGYLRPLQLFLLVNVLLFVAAPRVPLFSYSLGNYLRHAPPSPALVTTLVQRATKPDQSRPRAASGAAIGVSTLERASAYATAFDARVETQRKSLIVLFAPALALVLWALFARRAAVPGMPRRYGEHLVFALHVLAFVWLVFAGSYGIANAFAGRALGLVGSISVFAGVLIFLLLTPVYVFRAVRRVYSLSHLWAAVVTAALGAAFFAFLLVYRGLLFFTTYYTL